MSSIYTRDILRLATETGDFPRLYSPSASIEHRSAVCGSRIIIDLRLQDDETISSVGFDVAACAFGQASSVLFAKHAVGLNLAELSNQTEGIKRWLGGGDGNPWPRFEALEPVRPLTARHGAVLLPFEAALKALIVQLAA